MSSFNAPRFIPPRYVEGDIYGFSVLLNNDVSSIDTNFPVWPFWNGEESAGGLTGGHITRPDCAGQLVGVGAIGKNPDVHLEYLVSPFETMDIMGPKRPDQINGTNMVKQPTWFEYSWYDPTDDRVKNSNQYTFSSAFHESYYISTGGKLRNIGTNYGTKPAIMRMFDNAGPVPHNGVDLRIFEIWQSDPSGFGYDSNIELKHICCAADETIMTLDTNGTIRIVQSGISGVELLSVGPEDDFIIVYFDKEDLEDHFWIDSTGTPVIIDNIDFIDCWCSGGGTPAQGICVWALKNDGTLYYQDMHNMIWQNKQYSWGTQDVSPHVDSKFLGEPWEIAPLDEEGTPGVLTLNPYHGAKILDNGGETSIIIDLNGYVSSRNTRIGSRSHQDNIESYFEFSVGSVDDPIYGNNSIFTGWSYEAGRHALNQIPKNASGDRFKVISLFDGYGHGGGCLCVDPDEEIGSPNNHQHPNQMVEPVLLNTWTKQIHDHMYEQIHKIKRYRVTKNGLNWDTEANTIGAYKFDQELFDLLYKDTETGTYVPPRRFSSTRRNFVIMTNTGMVASFQGAGAMDDSGDLTSTETPLVNYEEDPDNPGNIKLILDINGSREQEGNWFYNYDMGPDGIGDPVQWVDDHPAAFTYNGVMSGWKVNYEDTVDSADPTRGVAHKIFPPSTNHGRFGFGNMPKRNDETIPGYIVKPWATIDLDWDAWSVSYFAWTKEVGYNYEENYWNQESLVYLWTGPDILGNTIYSNPDEYNKGSSIIHVWHVGEGSPYEPFTSDPVIWWSGQGDNINVIFKSGTIDSCSYYEAEMSACIMPPLSLPVTLPSTEGPDRPDDPDPLPEGLGNLLNITQDTEIEPGTTDGGGIDPEDPGCGDTVDDEPDVGGEDGGIIIP